MTTQSKTKHESTYVARDGLVAVECSCGWAYGPAIDMAAAEREYRVHADASHRSTDGR